LGRENEEANAKDETKTKIETRKKRKLSAREMEEDGGERRMEG